MTVEIPTDLAPFVNRMIAEKRFLSQSDVLAEALRLLQSRESLRNEVQKGFQQLDEGMGIPADKVYPRVERQLGFSSFTE